MHCTQCSSQIPDGAKFCPSCGAAAGTAAAPAVEADPKAGQNLIGCGLLAAITGALMLFTCDGGEDEKATADAAKAAAEHRAKGFHCLSKWDGANASLVEQVKKQLRDPGSFEHDETRIAPISEGTEGKHPLTMRFRARNGFGGMNIGSAVALVDPRSCKAELVSVNAD